MAILTVRLPDQTHARLKELARQRNSSVNKLFEQWSNMAIAEFDAEMRFRAMAMRGSRKLSLSLLDKLDEISAQSFNRNLPQQPLDGKRH